MDSMQKITEQPDEFEHGAVITVDTSEPDELGAAIESLAGLDPAEAPDRADAIADRLGDTLAAPHTTDGAGDATT